MRRLGSLVMRAADEARVPAGAALAVDRHVFAQAVTRAVAGASAHPHLARRSACACPARSGRRSIIATGPLTSDALSKSIQEMVGEEHLAFYDAISPIVLAESIDMSKVFRASRWGRNVWSAVGADGALGALSATDEGDYLNCPMTKAEYDAFYAALVAAESATVHDFDKTKFFEGCLPIEVMAHRGEGTLRFGPMKPVGLKDPRTGQLPYAVVQLRQDTLAGDHYSLVGFQTQIKWGDQARVLEDDSRPRERRVRSLRHGASQHLYLRAEGAAADVADPAPRRSVVRRPGVGRRGLRRIGGLGVDRRPQRRGASPEARRRRRRRAPPRLARWPITCRMPTRRPISRPTSRTASCRRWSNPPRDKMKKKLMIAERALADLDAWRGAFVAAGPLVSPTPGPTCATTSNLFSPSSNSIATCRRTPCAPTRATSRSISRGWRAKPARRCRQLEAADLDMTVGAVASRRAGQGGKARSSVARKLSALRTFVRYLRREDLIEHDPTAMAVAPKRDQTIPVLPVANRRSPG